jgi:hypothetical protein
VVRKKRQASADLCFSKPAEKKRKKKEESTGQNEIYMKNELPIETPVKQHVNSLSIAYLTTFHSTLA